MAKALRPNPAGGVLRPNLEEMERFFAKVAPNKITGCWIWAKGLVAGYGSHTYEGRSFLAHVLAYEWFVGPITEGFEIDHLCVNPRCCNPSHLEAVTHAENLRRWAGLSTHCVNGHERTEENSYYRTAANGRTRKLCVICLGDSRRRSNEVMRSRNRKRAFAAVRAEETTHEAITN